MHRLLQVFPSLNLSQKLCSLLLPPTPHPPQLNFKNSVLPIFCGSPH